MTTIDETPRPFFRFFYSEPGGWDITATATKPDGEVVPVPQGCVTGADSEQEARDHAAAFLPQIGWEPGTVFTIDAVELIGGPVAPPV